MKMDADGYVNDECVCVHTEVILWGNGGLPLLVLWVSGKMVGSGVMVMLAGWSWNSLGASDPPGSCRCRYGPGGRRWFHAIAAVALALRSSFWLHGFLDFLPPLVFLYSLTDVGCGYGGSGFACLVEHSVWGGAAGACGAWLAL